MRMIATIDDPVVIRKILTHLGLPTEVPAPGRRQAICSPGDLSQPQRAARARRAQVCPARESGARAGWLALVLLRYSLYWVRCTRWSSVRHLMWESPQPTLPEETSQLTDLAGALQ